MKFPFSDGLEDVVKDLQSDNYSKSYPHFVGYFADRKGIELDVRDTVIGISFTYSWMPTILNIGGNKGDIEKCTDILNRVKKDEELKISEFEILEKTINNSKVGASKILHFISPALYPIWDSNVRAAIGQKGKFNYLDFKILCGEKVKEVEFLELHKAILIKKLYGDSDFEHSKLRSLDLLLFAIGKKSKK